MIGTGEGRQGAGLLWSEIERVYQNLVDGHGVEGEFQAVEGYDRTPRNSQPMPSLDAIKVLREALGLTSFELDLLLLCAGKSLNVAPSALDSQGAPGHADPSFRIMLESLGTAHWSVLSRARPLRYWSLIEIGAGPLLDAPLRIDDRILHFLLDIPTLDERLDGVFRPLPQDHESDRQTADASIYESLVSRAVQHWQARQLAHMPIVLLGGTAAERTSFFRQMCEAAGLLAWQTRAADLPENAVDRERLARAWTREAVLAPAALLVSIEVAEDTRKLQPWLERVNAPVVLASETEFGTIREGLRLTLPKLANQERKRLWRRYLGPVIANSFNGHLDRMVEAFPLDREQIHLAADSIRQQIVSVAPESGSALAWRLCREQARRPLDQLALRVEQRSTWSDLVLPEAQTTILRQIGVHAREAAVVNQQWGFAERYSLGLGLSALLHGSSGTGKTMAAGILARSLDRDLYQIDLSTVVSKYIGDTEKHLRRIFDAAEQSGAILLFDEADALFGKRSQVKDSHDRYANLEISYLLQRMEAYRGIALLTTNMQHALDPAFVRRLRFVVQFPFPGPEDRVRIWRGIFPANAPVQDLNFERLAQLNVAGGVIRNIAFHSAFLAAGSGGAITMCHVLAAARTEYGKMDKPLSAAEIRGWE